MMYERDLAKNRQAFFAYHILDRLEAGMVLTGTEVKSMRMGLCNLKDSYARLDDGEIWLFNCHIGPYPHGNRMNHEPLRPRKLLLHRNQILKLERQLKGGTTLVPLKVYLKARNIKVELGLAKGKQLHDKRASIKEKEQRRETEAALKAHRQQG